MRWFYVSEVPRGSPYGPDTLADRLDIRLTAQVIIDGLAARGKAPDSKWNRRKCNPNRECRSIERRIQGPGSRCFRLAGNWPREKNAHASYRDIRNQCRIWRNGALNGLRRPVSGFGCAKTPKIWPELLGFTPSGPWDRYMTEIPIQITQTTHFNDCR